jgi:quinol monooxygenase YgiN
MMRFRIDQGAPVLVVIANLSGKSDKREECKAALAKAAAASRGDAGCLGYTFSVDVENPDHYVSVELWEDQAALDAHFGAPHLAELMTVAADLLAGEVDIKTYSVS